MLKLPFTSILIIAKLAFILLIIFLIIINNDNSILSHKYIKKSNIPVDQLKILLSYVNQKALKEYLYISNIYKGKKNLTTNELINLIINANNTNANDTYKELTMDEVNNILINAKA